MKTCECFSALIHLTYPALHGQFHIFQLFSPKQELCSLLDVPLKANILLVSADAIIFRVVFDIARILLTNKIYYFLQTFYPNKSGKMKFLQLCFPPSFQTCWK